MLPPFGVLRQLGAGCAIKRAEPEAPTNGHVERPAANERSPLGRRERDRHAPSFNADDTTRKHAVAEGAYSSVQATRKRPCVTGRALTW